METESVDDENTCVDIDQSCSFEPPHLQSPDLSSFNAGNLSPIPTANSASKFYAVESLDSSLYKEDSFEKSDDESEKSEKSVEEDKSEKSPEKSVESPTNTDQSPTKSIESPTKTEESPAKTDMSPQISGLSPVFPGYDQFELNKSGNNLNKSIVDESSIYPDESLVLIDKYPIAVKKPLPDATKTPEKEIQRSPKLSSNSNSPSIASPKLSDKSPLKSPKSVSNTPPPKFSPISPRTPSTTTPPKFSPKLPQKSSPSRSPPHAQKPSPKSPSRSPPHATQTEPSANEDSLITVMESPVRLNASNYYDHSPAYQSPSNVSRSYVISEDGSHHHVVDDFYDDATDCEIDVSKSYIISEKTDVESCKRNTNRLSDIVESKDSVPKGETQSINVIMPDSLEIRNTQRRDDADIAENLADDIMENMAAGIAENMAADIAENIAENMAAGIAENIAENMATDIAQKMATETAKNDSNSADSQQNDKTHDNSEDEPPSLKSIKSIAERKKQKMMECRKNMERRNTTTEESSSNTENNIEGEGAKKINRYPVNKESTPKASRIARPTTKKASPLKVQKKSLKKPTVYARSDFHARNPTPRNPTPHNPTPRNPSPRKDDKLQHDVKQLQILNEKERKNNYKMHQDMVASQNKWKVEKQKLCSEYEKKISELNRQISVIKKSQRIIGGGASSNIAAPSTDSKTGDTSDDDMIEKLQKQLELQETMITGFQEENKTLYDKLKEQGAILKDIQEGKSDERRKLLVDMDSLKMTHVLELEKMEKKLKWYGENQVLLDQDMNELKESREMIRAMKVTINQYELEIKKLKTENMDLQKVINDKENMRGGKPNILPTTEPSPSNPIIDHEAENEKQKPLTVYLERRIKILENELEERDNDGSRKIRSIEQKYSIMTIEYEDEIKKLESKIQDLILENKSLQESRGDIETVRNEYSIEILDLKNEISTNEEEIRLLKAKLSTEGPKKNTPLNLKQTDQYKRSLREKDAQINELAEKILILEKDRKLLTGELQSHLSGKDFGKTYRKNDNVDAVKKASEELEAKYSAASAEIDQLKAHIDEIQIESEQRRLRYEAIDAQSQNEVRMLTEKFEEEKTKCEEEHQRVIEKIKVDFAVEHSNSKVAELNAKVTGLELMMEHMKAMLEETRVERFNYMQLKQSEEKLKSKVNELEKELLEMESLGSPGVQEYKLLVTKINNMERNHQSREEKLKTIIEGMKTKAEVEVEEIEEKWRVKLSQKDDEVNRFREELDGIIEVLEELQRQGVVLPKCDDIVAE